MAKALKLTSVDMPKLAGCYCINNSCGTNLAWGNMASVLRAVGEGGALAVGQPNLFIGPGGHGHTFPGASLTFGMAHLNPGPNHRGRTATPALHNRKHTPQG